MVAPKSIPMAISKKFADMVQIGEKHESPEVHLPAEVEQGKAFPSCLTSSYKQVSFS